MAAVPVPAALGRLLLADHDMHSLLQQVAEAALQEVPGVDEVSVTLVDGRPATVASTGPRAERLDETQYAQGFGPCLSAAAGSGDLHQVPDTATEQRWAEFAEAAREIGVGCSASLCVPVPGDAQAALNLYATAAHALDDDALEVAGAFASYAGVTIANMAVHEQVVRTVAQLHEAMRSRAVIEQAKGVLMARHGGDADAAFDRLREASSLTNRKLRDVAQDVVDSVRDRS